MMVERAWLTVPYLGPKFIRYLTFGAWTQAAVLMLPIALANFLLVAYNPLFLYAGLSLVVDVPLISAFLAYVQAATFPMQFRGELTPLNAELRARGHYKCVPLNCALLPRNARSLFAVLTGNPGHGARDRSTLAIINSRGAVEEGDKQDDRDGLRLTAFAKA